MMKNIPVKIMTCAALITTLATASVVPSYTAAAETTVTTGESEKLPNLPDKYLGPAGLQKALEETGSHVIVMDAYALTMLKAPDFKFDTVNVFKTSSDKDLVNRVLNAQKTSKGHATYWLDVLKPNLINLNQGIVNYGTKFDNYYQTIVDAVDEKDKETTKLGIERLYKSVEEHKQTIDQLVKDLQTFRNTLFTDSQSFTSSTDSMIAKLAGNDAAIAALQQEIAAYNKQVDTATKMIIGGSVTAAIGAGLDLLGVGLIATGVGTPLGVTIGLVGGIGFLGGIAAVATGAAMLTKANNHIKDLTTQLTELQQQVVSLELTKGQTKAFAETIDLAIASAQVLADQWTTMGSKYKSLLNNIDDISPNALAFVKEDLKTAKDSWLNIKAYADTLYTKVTIKK